MFLKTSIIVIAIIIIALFSFMLVASFRGVWYDIKDSFITTVSQQV
ncbi:MAG: hypothetical protein LBG52_00080 [Candidatus Peribacteria bacterium]|nr:hypothetical protein [Candidatus Peribacteria bacterium]